MKIQGWSERDIYLLFSPFLQLYIRKGAFGEKKDICFFMTTWSGKFKAKELSGQTIKSQ